jgi:DNA (cytosine-5)-methyltransferase 1
MRYGSVCSGIEAATTAWHGLGWEPAFFSEIEAFPRSVLEHHYPNVPLHGDFTTITENQYGKIDLLVGGTPCQSFSVAGLRGGLDDERGNLALEFCRLAQRERPRWIVWENVPGVLSSSGGRDFGSILGALAELGYGLAYRVLDAQYFGVPQRRRRVFLVGYFGDHRPAAAVLFERQSLSRNTPPRREARESSTHDLAPCIGASGRGFDRTGETRGQDPVVATGGRERFDLDWPADVTGTLDAEYGSKWGQNNQHINGGCTMFVPTPDVAGALRIRRPGEGGVQGDFDHIVPCVSPALNTQSGSHHAPDTKAYVVTQYGDVAGSLTARHDSSPCADRGQNVVAFQQNTRDEVRLMGGDGGIAGALAAQPGMKQQNYLAYTTEPPVAFQSSESFSSGTCVNVSPTLKSSGGNPPAVAYSIMPMNSGKDYKARETDVAQPIMAGGPVGGNQGGDYIVGALTAKGPEAMGAPEVDAGHYLPVYPVGGNQGGDYILQPVAHVDVMPTLRAAASQDGPGHGARSGDSKDEYIVPVYPIDTQNMTEGHASGGLGFGAQGDPSFTLTKGHSHAVAYDLRGREGGAQFEGPHDTANIRAASGGSSKSYVAASAVRRLTPRECERLQGFPDDYTLVDHRKKPAADGPRYKALGNSMAVPVMQWIGKRIQLVDDLLSVL